MMEHSIEALCETVARLRAPDGCPWDQEQTHQSLCDCLVEECSELLDTIDREDMEHMREELGDVLLQVVMHAQLAEEEGSFDFSDVANDINDKLIRRHPHVFEGLELKDSDAVLHNWEKIKASENKRGPEGKVLFKHLPPHLPALLYARDVYKQIKKKAMPYGAEICDSRVDELSKDLDENSAGQMLFEITAACWQCGVDPESALRRQSAHIMSVIEQRES